MCVDHSSNPLEIVSVLARGFISAFGDFGCLYFCGVVSDSRRPAVAVPGADRCFLVPFAMDDNMM